MKKNAPSLLLIAMVLACAPVEEKGPPLPLDTVEVGGPVDAELSMEEDAKGRRLDKKGQRFLPGDFPKDFPLPTSMSLTDYGQTADRSYLLLRTATDPSAARAELESRVTMAGWTLESRGGGAFVARLNDRLIDLVFTDTRPGAEIRVIY